MKNKLARFIGLKYNSW